MLIIHYTSKELNELSVSDDEHIRRLVLELRVVAQDFLLARIYELSKKYLDGELYGIDIALWRALQDGPKSIDEEDLIDLNKLTELAGGWWSFESTLEPVFLNKEEWENYYNDRLRG